MGRIHKGIPNGIAIFLKNIYDINIFIETGTYKGKTSLWASQYFQKVYTIEKSESIYNDTVHRLGHIKNIDFLLGHSAEKLKEILRQVQEPAIFWLDAHWSAGITYGKDEKSPLIDELKIILKNSKYNLLLIDDASLFLAPPPKPHKIENWPTIHEILDNFNKYERYTIIYEDVIISIPSSEKFLLAKYIQEKVNLDWKKEGMVLQKYKGFKNFLKKTLLPI